MPLHFYHYINCYNLLSFANKDQRSQEEDQNKRNKNWNIVQKNVKHLRIFSGNNYFTNFNWSP